jgi:hypothetical protein
MSSSSSTVSGNKVPGSRHKGGRLSNSIPAHISFALTDGSVPCVMVDTEPKVIRRCLDVKHSGSTVLMNRVSQDSCVWDKAGRGNNWAYGYHGSGASGCDGTLLDRVQETVRKVVERCDRFSGFVMFHSMAGGTGSGVFPLSLSLSLANCKNL